MKPIATIIIIILFSVSKRNVSPFLVTCSLSLVQFVFIVSFESFLLSLLYIFIMERMNAYGF